jgi:hypothetical protein
MKNKISIEEPYFMKNEDWYYFDEVEFKYKLTDKATKEAIKSYEEYYKLLDERIVD